MEKISDRMERMEEMIQDGAGSSISHSHSHNTTRNTNSHNNTTTNTHSHNTNSNNVNITLVNFGEENFDSLTKEEILKIIGSRYSSIQQFVEHTHLNDRLPEQKNVYISNLRSNQCKVVEGGRWVTRDTNKVVDEIVANGVANIGNYLDNHHIRLSEERMDKLVDLLRKVSDEDEEKFTKSVKRTIKHLLYDNKDRVSV
jgi:hypothetical protein